MLTKITAIVLIIAGFAGLIWGGITAFQGAIAARQSALMLQQMGGGRFQGNQGEALPGAMLPRANFGSTYTVVVGGLMVLVSLLLIGVGEALWMLARLSAAPQTVEVHHEARL